MENVIKDLMNSAKKKMDKTYGVVQSEFSKLRTGKASPALLEDLPVEVYGQAMPIKQLASITVPDARMIVVQPWDKGTMEPIEKAIQKSDLGLNPQNDGNIIRVHIPPLSEERRQELVKVAHRIAEEGKVAIRSIRRDTIDTLKQKEKEKDISEDFRYKGEKDIQKITDEETDKIDKALEEKEQEILKI
ncbi:MAG: ribosome recycling factor [Candidatus Zixiibacteriota bacterium]